MTKIQIVKLSFVVAALALGGCSPKVENRGYISQGNFKESIKVGQTSKDDVLQKFGSPSSQSSFGPESWYYISSRKEGVGFMKPSVVEQDVVDISFDSAGIVTAVDSYDKDSAKDVDLVKRTTPTEGHSLSFIDQTLGNLGRFNKPSSGSDSVATGRRPAGRGGF